MLKNGYENRVSDLKQEIKELTADLEQLEEFSSYIISALASAYCALDYVKVHNRLPDDDHQFSIPELVDKLVEIGLDRELVESIMVEVKLEEQAELAEQSSDTP